MKRRQKAGFLSPISSKITVTKEKEEKEKERATGRSRRRREIKQWLHSSFYNSYFGVFCPKKQVKKECLTQKVHLAIKFSKIRPDMYFFIFFFTVLRKSCNNVNPNACSPRTKVKLFFRFFFFLNWIAFPSNSSLN